MLRRFGLFFYFTFCFHSVILASGSQNQTISLDLTNEGLDFLAEQVTESFPQLLRNVPVDDINFNLVPIESFFIKGVRVSADVDSFKLKPRKNGLQVNFRMKELNISIRELRSQNYLFSSLGTSCYGTNIVLGGRQSVPVFADVGARLRRGKLDFSVDKISFQLKQNQYTTYGPQSCKTIGINNILAKVIIKKALKHSRKILNSAFKSHINKLVPILNKKADELLAMKVPFSVPENIFLEETHLQFQMKPIKLDIAADHFKVAAKLHVVNVDKETTTPNFNVPKDGVKRKIANIALTPAISSKLLVAALSKGTKEFEITPDMHEFLGEVLKRETLVEFWPDLALAESDQELMKLFIGVPVAPIVEKAENGSLSIKIPRLEMKYQISQDGVYKPYFDIHVSLDVTTNPQANNGLVTISETSATSQIEGEWGEGYQPQDPTFHSDVVEQFIYLVTEFAIDDVVKFNLPEVPLGDKILSLDHLKVEDNQIQIDVFSTK